MPRTSEEGKEFTACSLISQCQGNGRQLLNGVQPQLQGEERKENPVTCTYAYMYVLVFCLATTFLTSLAARTNLLYRLHLYVPQNATHLYVPLGKLQNGVFMLYITNDLGENTIYMYSYMLEG